MYSDVPAWSEVDAALTKNAAQDAARETRQAGYSIIRVGICWMLFLKSVKAAGLNIELFYQYETLFFKEYKEYYDFYERNHKRKIAEQASTY